MRKPIKRALLFVGLAVPTYLLLWPVPLDPVAWVAPGEERIWNETGSATIRNEDRITLAAGPEDVSEGPDGSLFTGTSDGRLFRLIVGEEPLQIANTGGRPLGIAVAPDMSLYVADAILGLVHVTWLGMTEPVVEVLADHTTENRRIGFADDLIRTRDGRIYFTDASSRFSPPDVGGIDQATLLEMVEHGRTGRLLEWRPGWNRARVVLDRLSFANGLALAPDESHVLICETGEYRVLRYHLKGPLAGSHETWIDSLPGFPDNINYGNDSRIWLALAAPRSAVLDDLAPWPFVRKIVYRLPSSLRPQAQEHGQVMELTKEGQIVRIIPAPGIGYTTSAWEKDGLLYVGNLHHGFILRHRL